jgi:hypothetical protein
MRLLFIIGLFALHGCFTQKQEPVYETGWCIYESAYKVEMGYNLVLWKGTVRFESFCKDTTGFNLHKGSPLLLTMKM